VKADWTGSLPAQPRSPIVITVDQHCVAQPALNSLHSRPSRPRAQVPDVQVARQHHRRPRIRPPSDSSPPLCHEGAQAAVPQSAPDMTAIIPGHRAHKPANQRHRQQAFPLFAHSGPGLCWVSRHLKEVRMTRTRVASQSGSQHFFQVFCLFPAVLSSSVSGACKRRTRLSTVSYREQPQSSVRMTLIATPTLPTRA